jgi:DNA-binding transcriptional regulator YhcF (GntR family)
VKPPYERIADDLRQRVESGELRPGDRVPSTRALARRWGVAIATAQHALRTLVNEGVLRSAPRVGTLVAPRSGRTEVLPAELSRERIVAAAIAIADAEGLAALSLRGVAAKMGAPVMSLYRHVKGKDQLLRSMIDATLSDEPLPKAAPIAWRSQLELAARAQWRAFRRHPWLGRLMTITRPSPLPNALAYAEWVLRALEGHGLTAAERMRMHIVLFGFVQGMAINLEAEIEAAGETGMNDDEWMHTQLEAFSKFAASGRFPAFARTLRELDDGFDLEFDQLFELGLQVLLDGFACRLAQSSRGRG